VSSDPYKIFGVGLNKTGTTTLAEALELLGLGPVARRAGEGDAHESVREALAGNYAPAIAYAKRYRSFEDRPWNIGHIYRELAAAYPDARFVLTQRAPERWWRSVERWLSVSKPGKLAEYCRHLEVDPDLARGGVEAVRIPMVERYERYNREVVEFFGGEERLLVIDFETGEGWPELCAFFEVPLPEAALPQANRQYYDARDHGTRVETLVKKARRSVAAWLRGSSPDSER